jgi:transcriptional regulator with XRE-family HTH domain
MGRAKRVTPRLLGEKLRIIRERFDVTLEGIITKLDCADIPLYPASISMYESGKREPPLLVLLRYAQLANVTMEMLVDDGFDIAEFEKRLR